MTNDEFKSMLYEEFFREFSADVWRCSIDWKDGRVDFTEINEAE
jgi:hypothetical protein